MAGTLNCILNPIISSAVVTADAEMEVDRKAISATKTSFCCKIVFADSTELSALPFA